jgi:DNA-binding GntR family transcriptional regulator
MGAGLEFGLSAADGVPGRRAARDRGVSGGADARGSVVESIVEVVLQGVRDGGFAPGQRLIEGDFQRRFGVSRGTVREALRRLAADGVVELRHNAGAMIRSLSRADLHNAFHIREALEGLAARLAAERVREGADLSALLDLDRDFRSGFDGSPAAYTRYNDRFHRLIVGLSGNVQLVEMVGRLNMRVYRLQDQMLRDAGSLRQSAADHAAIVRSLVAGDGARAERLMRRHIRRRLDAILAGPAESFA